MNYASAYRSIPIACLAILFFHILLFAARAPELYTSHKTGACLNPLGLLVDSRLMYQIPLSKDTGILFRTTKVEAGIINEWSPGDELFGITLNYEPVAFFNCRARFGIYENYRLLGFGYVSVDTAVSAWHDTSMTHHHQRNRSGFRASIEPTLQLKYAHFILVNNVIVNRIDILNEDGFFYDLRTSLPHSVHDVNISNDVLLLYEGSTNLLFGINHGLVKVLKADIRQQKLGGIAIYSGSSAKYRSFFALVTGGLYLEHPFRKNTPYIAAMCGFELKLRPSGISGVSSGKILKE